jgi:hypothetical protein
VLLLEVVAVEHEWGQPVDVERVLAAHDSPAIIAAVHAETSTGVRSDIAALGAGKGDALLVTDAVTSIAGIELRADEDAVAVRLRRHGSRVKVGEVGALRNVRPRPPLPRPKQKQSTSKAET